MSVLIRNGRIVTAADDYRADVFVEGETVALIGRDLTPAADWIIDAAGRLVLPGGVDPHTHMEMPFGGTESSDTFETGTRAATFRGMNERGMGSAKARIDQQLCIKCGRCYAACEDTSHQSIAIRDGRVFEVIDAECVACNLCVVVCPVEDCITMEPLPVGAVDTRTGKVVEPCANWTTHAHNPAARPRRGPVS